MTCGKVCPRCMGHGVVYHQTLRERLVERLVVGSVLLVVVPLTWLHAAGLAYYARMGWRRPW